MNDLIKIIIPLLIQIESGGDPNAIGDKGLAVGILQLHPIYVKDVNLSFSTHYTLEDRFDKQKSIEITTLYLKKYGRAYERATGRKVTPEVLARIHNGGPNGWKKKSTNKYWNRCKKLIEDKK